MNVASQELCQELYELSGWEETTDCWANRPNHRPAWLVVNWSDARYAEMKKLTPAYDLGYLLRKLPINKAVEFSIAKGWAAIHDSPITSTLIRMEADTPEDAACKLAIELFKQGVLSHDSN